MRERTSHSLLLFSRPVMFVQHLNGLELLRFHIDRNHEGRILTHEDALTIETENCHGDRRVKSRTRSFVSIDFYSLSHILLSPTSESKRGAPPQFLWLTLERSLWRAQPSRPSPRIQGRPRSTCQTPRIENFLS